MTTINDQKRNTKGQVVGSTPTLAIVKALDDALVTIRSKHSELGNVVLVVGSQGTTRKSVIHGHFAADSWEAKNAKHEVMISGESLKRGAEATLGTLLHESAHALAHARGVQDTSRGGRYHNKRFKAVAEELGIWVDYDDRIGWSLTQLPKETAKAYRTELTALRKALKAYRVPRVKAAVASKNIRLLCACRGLTVPISFYNNGGLTCQLCDSDFTPATDTIEED